MFKKIIHIEGNIGAGKSTLEKIFKEKYNFIFFKENVNKKIIQKFYDDPKRWMFISQINFLLSFKEIFQEIEKSSSDIFIVERSPTSAMLFALLGYEKKYLDQEEYETLKKIHQELNLEIKNSIFETVYLFTEKEECYKRINLRNNLWEKHISLDYLDEVEQKMNFFKNNLTIDGKQTSEKICEDIFQKLRLENRIYRTMQC
jgi:deoxyadenosine/deoxycytidine kinase